MSRIVVTGIGMISAIGDSVDSNRTALQKGICGISSIDLFETKYAKELPFGEIKISNAVLKDQ
ncbi:MAG: beta-ketoacyl-[acyl-carrier-protein] synthase family protein, partial [Cytophaga sp.]